MIIDKIFIIQAALSESVSQGWKDNSDIVHNNTSLLFLLLQLFSY